ncbi:hypothetical protein [Spiroplasma floricola]|uniref:Lipoprotein n=1 Tax=Spiroplasma floricola 23-6 TaxID=1336749 RepID=A0A2K8SGQ7_9MOLU|nr:hypothetical protein [Spiroplasma floricola]AUB32010.1 hypothetical protein SFLOR_v1c09620 [Spiroplasma floricola 23-6]
MKKLLLFLGASSLIVSTSSNIASCGWVLSGSLPGIDKKDDKNPYNIVNILKTPKEKLDVIAKTKQDWNYISSLYSKERDKTKKGVEEFSQWEKNSSGEAKQSYKKLRLTLEVLYSWYLVIYQETDFYLYLYENKIDIDYDKEDNLLNNILVVNDKIKLLELSRKTSNLYINIKKFTKIQTEWWNYLTQDPKFEPNKYEKEKEAWEYLKNPIMSSKINKYTKFANKIDEQLNKIN